MQKQRIEAVLFDYDGVVADTMTDNFLAWKYAFSQHGCSIDKDEYMASEGMTPGNIAETLGNKCKLEPTLYPQIAELKDRFYRENNNFRLYPQTSKILSELKQAGVKLALVSGAAKQRLVRITPQKIIIFFDVIVTANDVKRGKPHPEPYQKVLLLLGISAAAAIVIENAPLGIQSAKRAGLYCIALTTTVDRKYLQEADEIVESHLDLSQRLRKIIA